MSGASNSRERLAELRAERQSIKGKLKTRRLTIERLQADKWRLQDRLRWVEADIAGMTGRRP